MKKKVPSLLTHRVDLKPAFQDLDIMNVVWHGRYWQFIETARHALFQKIGYGYPEMIATGYQYPIVQADIKYIRPITLEQDFYILADLLEFENRIKIQFRFYDSRTDQLLCQASSTQVAMITGDQHLQFMTPACWQDKVRSILEENAHEI
ncbi:acyl-CoA thioesterase [Pasteurella sp. PK-2025]|uniref:acyl-CoA thioesterase n=1 Tax=unclassified Pasteurella TaxID=2621516 RepID=UPI003C757B7C